MTDTKEHPGVVALREKLKTTRQHLVYWQQFEGPSTEEGKIMEQIAQLHEQLALVRRHRQESAATLHTKRAEIQQMEKTLELCLTNPKVAQAVWLKLLTER